jgi:SagB-type dehydrogenase family enzyme
MYPSTDVVVGQVDFMAPNFPSAWSEIHYKAYPRYRRVPLALDHARVAVDVLLTEAAFRRRSTSSFDGSSELTLEEISFLFRVSCGINRHTGDRTDDYRRVQPSGGARYPIEIYILQRQSSDLDRGLYHFNSLENCLEMLPYPVDEVMTVVAEPLVNNAPAFVFLTYVMPINAIKYRERGLALGLIEAGHIGQGFCLGAAATGIKIRPFLGFDQQAAMRALRLPPGIEYPIYMLALGR